MMKHWDNGYAREIAHAALSGAISNIERARELQVEHFQASMLEGWAYDYEEDHVFPGDTLREQYEAEYSKRADCTVENGHCFDLTSEAYEEIDAQGGVDSGLGIALDVLRKMLQQIEQL